MRAFIPGPDYESRTGFPSGKQTYHVEIALAYRTVLEVAAGSEEEAEEKALKKLESMGPDLIDAAQVLVSVA